MPGDYLQALLFEHLPERFAEGFDLDAAFRKGFGCFLYVVGSIETGFVIDV